MAANKYVEVDTTNGRLKEAQGVQSSAGAGDAGKYPALDAAGKLDSSMMPTGVAADTKSIAATENLAAGDLVNIYISSGVKCRKADATAAGKEAHGFVLAAVTSGNNATVYFEQINNQVSGLTPGAMYFLNTTAGGVTSTPPTGSGNVIQRIGPALSATELEFMPGDPVVLA